MTQDQMGVQACASPPAPAASSQPITTPDAREQKHVDGIERRFQQIEERAKRKAAAKARKEEREAAEAKACSCGYAKRHRLPKPLAPGGPLCRTP